MTKNNIYIYSDLGVSEESLKHLNSVLMRIIPKNFRICSIIADQIIQGHWTIDAQALVIPGGADIYYHSQLRGVGNKIIKDYIAGGGSYLGICAGAYYGSKSIEFDLRGPLQVVEERELAFFPGIAVGPLVTYSYENNSGARAINLKLSLPITEAISSEFLRVYYNGGPYFKNADFDHDVEILACYESSLGSSQPAIIKIPYNQGVVILSGVHFEYSPNLLDRNDIFHRQIYTQLNQNEENRIKFASYIVEQLGII